MTKTQIVDQNMKANQIKSNQNESKPMSKIEGCLEPYRAQRSIRKCNSSRILTQLRVLKPRRHSPVVADITYNSNGLHSQQCV